MSYMLAKHLFNLPLTLIPTNSSHCTQFATCNNVSFHTWHACLGHLSNDRLLILHDVVNANLNKRSYSHYCSVCPLAKHCRLASG